MCCESGQNLRGFIEGFGSKCRSEEGDVDRWNEFSEWEIMFDDSQLVNLYEFKYLGYIMDEKRIDNAKCSRKIVNGIKVTGIIKSWIC